MTETVFKTTKSSIAVFRQMIDQANKEHETALKNLKNNYIATEQGLNTSFEFAPMDQQLSALDELQENCRLFVFGTNTETGETYNRWGHNQQFLGYGDTSKGNSYEQLLLTSDAEIERLENEYMAKNPLFSEDDFVADTIRGMSAIEGTTKQLHYLNNKIKNMTAEQKSEIVNRLSMSKSEDMRLLLSSSGILLNKNLLNTDFSISSPGL